MPTGVANGYDERGYYRIWGLPPGEYLIQAGPTVTTVSDLVETTVADLQWATRTTGRPVGSGALEPAPRSVHVAFPPCYYPGTSEESQALPVSVGVGEERTGVNYRGSTVRAATIRGQMFDPTGSPPAAVQAAMVLPNSMVQRPPTVIVRPAEDGTFSVSRVPPGDYVLVVRGAMNGEAAGTPPSSPAPGSVFSPTLPLWATINLSVNGVDLENVGVHLQRGMTVAGRVALDRRAASSPPDFSAMRVNLIPSGGNLSLALTAPPASVSPDGTFTLTGVPANSFRVSVAMAAADARVWTFGAASIGGRDAADLPIDIGAGEDVTDALVTLTDSPAELSGRLLDGTGQPVPGYALLAFSTDPRYWLSQSRRVALVHSATDGSYTFTGLPPGEYYLCAASDIAEARIDDSGLLETLVGIAVRVTLGDGEEKQLDFAFAAAE